MLLVIHYKLLLPLLVTDHRQLVYLDLMADNQDKYGHKS